VKNKIFAIIILLIVIGGFTHMAYDRINWQDWPSAVTPVNATNLNKMDKGIYDNSFEIGNNAAQLDDLAENKADKSEINSLATQKADKTYVDTLTSSIASGSPKGTYATLALLQAAYPTGTTGIYIVTADGKWYYWNGSAWTAGGTYQSTGIADGSIAQSKLSFVPALGKTSMNLFDKSTVSIGYIDYTTGTLVVNASFRASDYIPVLANTSYVKKTGQSFAYYNSSKAYISGVVGGATLTTPSTAAYVRLTVDLAYVDTEQLELGTVSTSYESFGSKLEPSAIKDNDISGLKVKDATISNKKLSFLTVEAVPSKNLFDKSTVTNGYLNLTTGEKIVSAALRLSDYIPITAGTTYKMVDGRQHCFYDTNKVFISGAEWLTTVTAPTGAAYIRIVVNPTNVDIEQLEVGSISTSYVPFIGVLSDKSIPESLKNASAYNDFEIELPSDIYLVSGESFSVYYNNVIKRSQKFRKGNYYIAFTQVGETVNKGTGLQYKWQYTPATPEEFTMKFSLMETYSGVEVASKTVNFHVIDSSLSANHNRTANVVTIGDSFADVYGLSTQIYNFITTNGGINNINMIGTRTSDIAEVKDDAISGFGYKSFYNAASGIAGTNPFYNSSTSKFDFSYYMAQNFPAYVPSGQTGNHVDAVLSILGINDLTLFEASGKTNYKTYIQHIIDSIKTYDPDIKILLSLVTCPPDTDVFEATTYNNGMSYVRFKKLQEEWNEMMLEFEDAANGVYIIPTSAHFNPETSMITTTYYPDKFNPGIAETYSSDHHPNATGIKYIADAYYQAMYNLVLR
jgi:hypothetical protein